MAEQSFPFENIDTTESQFSEWATNFQETGVQGSPTGTELGITVTGSDLNLTVAAGQAFIRGHYYINTSDLVLAVTSAGVNTRIDIVVVELDPEANTIVTKIVSGEAVSADPVAPTLTQSATGIYQLPIATLTIPTSTVAITTGMLVDTRTFMGNRIGIWTTATRPANPTAYQTLGYNATIDSHESWNGTAWVGFFDPITTEGDLVVGDGTGQASRLGIGADDQVLTVVSGVPAWADGGGGNYYNITAAGTYTVDLAAGLYDVSSIGSMAVGGESVNGNAGLLNYPSGIDSVTAYASYNLDGFISRTSGTNQRLNGVAYGNGVYVLGGSAGVMRSSTNGTTWTTRTSGFGTEVIYGITYGEGLFVAVGSAGTLTSSPDGTTWTSRTSGFGTTPIYGVFYGNALFIAVGSSGKLTTSTDGITWTSRTSAFGTQAIYGATYGNGLYVVGGGAGTLTTSPDGTTWTSRTSGFGTTEIKSLTYGNGIYVAVGQSGVLTTSPDGTTWTARTSGFGTSGLEKVLYANGSFIAVGNDEKLTTSSDGITWTLRASSPVYTTYAVIQGGGLYVVVGGSGEVATSAASSVNSYLSIEPKSPLISLPA